MSSSYVEMKSSPAAAEEHKGIENLFYTRNYREIVIAFGNKIAHLESKSAYEVKTKYLEPVLAYMRRLQINHDENVVTSSDAAESFYGLFAFIEATKQKIESDYKTTFSIAAIKSITQAFDNLSTHMAMMVKANHSTFAAKCKAEIDRDNSSYRWAVCSILLLKCEIAACWCCCLPAQYTCTLGNCFGQGDYCAPERKTRLGTFFECYNATELKDGETKYCAPRNSILSLWDRVDTKRTDIIALENLAPERQRMT